MGTKKRKPIKLKEPLDVLYRIKRGLSGYISYLAACEMNKAFSEYVLYEPILRILTARGFTSECEYAVDSQMSNKKGGDKKRIDFVAKKGRVQFAMEVKWAKAKSVNVNSDHAKLKQFMVNNRESQVFICVFGRKSHIEDIRLKPASASEVGKPVFVIFGKTRYGCRIYKVN